MKKWGLKALGGLILLSSTFALCQGLTVNASMPKDKITLYGDDAFKAEMILYQTMLYMYHQTEVTATQVLLTVHILQYKKHLIL